MDSNISAGDGKKDHESNSRNGQSRSINWCNTNVNASENGAPHLENPFRNISEQVDDYSLHYVYSMGLRYCANLKKREGNNSTTSTAKGMPGDNPVKSVPPLLTSPNDVSGGCDGGGNGKRPENNYKVPLQNYRPLIDQSSKYPNLSSYLGNLETFRRSTPNPINQRKGKSGMSVSGLLKSMEEPIWDYGIESTQLQNKPFNKNFYPCDTKDEIKEVSKDEHCTALKIKTKDISSKGTSTGRGVSRITKKTDDERWKGMLKNPQDFKGDISTDFECMHVSNTTQPTAQSTVLSGTGKWLQNSDDNAGGSYGIEGISKQTDQQNHTSQFNDQNRMINFTDEEDLLNNFSWAQVSQVDIFPGIEKTSNEKNSKNVAAEGNLKALLDYEDSVFSGIWGDNSSSAFDDDCFILPSSSNKGFQTRHGDQNKILSQNMIEENWQSKAGGNSIHGSNQGFTAIGSKFLDPTVVAATKLPTNPHSQVNLTHTNYGYNGGFIGGRNPNFNSTIAETAGESFQGFTSKESRIKELILKGKRGALNYPDYIRSSKISKKD